MKFHFTWDPSAANQLDFQGMVQQVGADIAAKCSANIDVSIQAGWGTILGSAPIDSGAVGESAPNGGMAVPFLKLRSALLAANPSLILPATDPNPTGAAYTVNPATAKALGLKANDLATDGWIGFSATPGVLSFDRSNLNGQFDAYGVIFHEITEVLGRSLSCSFNSLEPLDLLHYAAVGLPIYTMSPGYFSMDGGVTALKWFNTVSGADAGDWRGDDLDPCNAVGSSGVVENPSVADWDVLQALGFMAATSPPPSPSPTGTFTASPASLNGPGSSTLTWSVSGATSQSIDNGIGAVPASGSMTVQISATTAFTLTMVNAAGAISTLSATVTEHRGHPVHPHKMRRFGMRLPHKK